MPPRKESAVWDKFDKVDATTVKCKVCKSVLSYKGGSTGSMHNHLKLKHGIDASSQDTPDAGGQVQQQRMTSYFRPGSNTCTPRRANQITRLIAKMIAPADLPFSFVEAEGFRDLMSYIEPDYQVPCRKTITTRIEEFFEEQKRDVRKRLEKAEAVSLTTDCWTSLTQDGYMTVTAHYVDENWAHKSAVLDTSPVGRLPNDDEDDDETEEDAGRPTGPQRHTAEALANQLQTVAVDWDIHEKVVAVVHDNASNCTHIAEALDATDVPCAAHTLQLSVKKGFESSNQMKTLIGAANRLVGHFKKSSVASKALEAEQRDPQAPTKPVHRLISSCKTRWNSTYEMMERLVELRWNICAVLSNPDYTSLSEARTLEMTNAQWTLMSDLIKCLKPIKVTYHFP